MDPIAQRARQQYTRQASFYSISRTHSQAESLGIVREWAACEPVDLAVDIATGTGFTAFALASNGSQSVVGYDLTEGMLAEASRLGRERGLQNLRWVSGLAEELPFANGSLDLVTCRVAPHHFHSVPTFCREAWRVLRPGGRFIVGDTITPDDPALDEWHNTTEVLRDPSHVRDYTRAEWHVFYATAGFTIDRDTETHVGPMDVTDWTTRAGTPSATIQEITSRFTTAPPATVAAFDIRSVTPSVAPNFSFRFPVIVIQGRK